MKKKIAISLIIVFFVFGVVICILTKVYNNKYNVLIGYINPEIKNIRKEIKSNANKLNEITEKNDNKQKAQENMNKYIRELENRVKTYEK